MCQPPTEFCLGSLSLWSTLRVTYSLKIFVKWLFSLVPCFGFNFCAHSLSIILDCSVRYIFMDQSFFFLVFFFFFFLLFEMVIFSLLSYLLENKKKQKKNPYVSSEEPLLGNFVSSQIPIHVDSPFRENLNFMIGFVSCFWHFDALSGLFWREKKSRLGTTTPHWGKRIRIPAFSLLMKPNTHISSLCVRERGHLSLESDWRKLRYSFWNRANRRTMGWRRRWRRRRGGVEEEGG